MSENSKIPARVGLHLGNRAKALLDILEVLLVVIADQKRSEYPRCLHATVGRSSIFRASCRLARPACKIFFVYQKKRAQGEFAPLPSSYIHPSICLEYSPNRRDSTLNTVAQPRSNSAWRRRVRSMPSSSRTLRRRRRAKIAKITAAFFLVTLAVRRASPVITASAARSSSSVSASFVRPPPTYVYSQQAGSRRRPHLNGYTTIGFREPPDSEDKSEAVGQEADIARWERMWEEGQLKRNVQMALDLSSSSSTVTVAKSEVRVISFDLDNTLWKTGEVISHANDVLSQYLTDKGVSVPVRTEVVMGELFKKDPKRYCPLAEFDEETGDSTTKDGDSSTDFDKAAGGEAKGVHISSGTSKPVLLTQLRIDALRDIFVRYNAFLAEEAQAAAEEAFQIWTKARHDAIPNHFARQVVESLEMLRTIESRDGHRVVIIAITDGNSDPRNVESLRPYFDIVVNSEQVGVAKPDARVYLKAAEQLLEHPRLEDVFLEAMGACKMLDDAVEKTDLLETAIGPWWVHIGDDFMKDIVAARDLGMRTIWSRELVRKAPNSAEEKDSAAKQLNGREGNSGGQTEKRSVADLVEELATMKVVEMSIGADEFLADSIHREFADEIVDDFASISDLLHEWHLDGSSNKDVSSPSSIPPVAVADEPKNEPKKDSAADSKSKKKFCVFCGTKLPLEANFCSSCGEPSVPVK